MQNCILPAIVGFFAVIGYYIHYVNSYIHENELQIYKMNYNINQNWYDCRGFGLEEFDKCRKCMEGTELATEIYETLANNMLGDLKIYCRKHGLLHKAPIYDEYNYIVYNLSPGPTALLTTIQSNNEQYEQYEQYENYEDTKEDYAKHTPQGRHVPKES